MEIPQRELATSQNEGRWVPWLGLAVAYVVMMGVCFGSVLWGGEQFAFRDAGHYYYPLYQRVQAEWDAGRWPLWEPEENSGMPLLGNPTAAVLYPGKLIYAAFPYPWAARLYTLAHTSIAFASMILLMRWWEISRVGSGLAALTYAFGAPILFQYCNIIYLVGAAWLPLGFLAVDAWVRGGRLWALALLAVVLAMQTLGGDPQASYLLGLCGVPYGIALAAAGRPRDPSAGHGPSGPPRRWRIRLLWVGAVIAWIAGTLILAERLPRLRPSGRPTPALPWMLFAPRVVLLLWGVGIVGFLAWWRKRYPWRPLASRLSGLAGAAALAAAISAAQLLPVIEFTQQTVRAAGDGPHDIYPFSVEPTRLVELIWPSVLGTQFGHNAYWFDAFRLPGARAKIWVPSLYAGSFGLILATTALTIRRGPPWRIWLSVVVVVSLLGSLGQYTSPIWAARVLAAANVLELPGIGPLDSNDITPIRQDGYLRDGDGSFYWWMSTVLPGFRQFRFPSKLLTFTVFGIAVLAGVGWDGLAGGACRRPAVPLALIGILSLGLLLAALLTRDELIRLTDSRKVNSPFGPIDATAGFKELIRALVHGAVVAAAGLGLVWARQRRLALAGLLALTLVSTDLAVANARYLATVPQADFETEPEVLRIIREAERLHPSPGPYRIHRMPQWNPPVWYAQSSQDRVRDFVLWERATIQPKYGITEGVEYTHSIGVAELYDYEWFFGGFAYTIGPDTARMLSAQPGQKVVYFPRRSFDMWNTRYFILPQYPKDWLDEYRSYAAFLHETEQVHPPVDLHLSEDKEAFKRWVETQDYQIRRNLVAFPRAWVVHDARGLPPMNSLARADRSGPMQEMLYNADPIWRDPTLHAYDPRQLVWIDRGLRVELARFLPGLAPRAAETVSVSYVSPQRVELEARLDAPGIVVLADVYYPGWKLTIDGRPAPVYRVNQIMRGAAVEAGIHRLVYEFDPDSFRIGGRISLAGLAILALLVAGSGLRGRLVLRQSAAGQANRMRPSSHT